MPPGLQPSPGIIPEGSMKIARRFNAGTATEDCQVPKGRLNRSHSAVPSSALMPLFITIRFYERRKFLQPRLEVFLIIPPAPNGVLEDRFCYLGVARRTHRLVPRMLMEKQHALIPSDSEKVQDAPGCRFQILHQLFIAHLH